MSLGPVWWSDAVRLVTFVVSMAALGSILGVLYQSREYGMTRYQFSRFTSLGIFVGATMVNEYVRFGYVATWHTWTDLVGSILAWYGTSALIRRHNAARDEPSP